MDIEEARQRHIQTENDKQAAIEDNLPTWTQMEAYLDGLANLAEAKVALKKIARVVYWIARNREE